MKKILILAGPTASGKSALALQIAQKTGGVIINADSRQLIADLRILTARPSPEEEKLAPHRLYGVIALSEHYSAGTWLTRARIEIDWALSQGKLPIVTGGTGLYLKALMKGIPDMPDIPASIRIQSVSDYEHMGKDAFAARLKEVDPEFFTRLKTFDKQRLVRAWEVWLGTGKPLSWWQRQGEKPIYPAEYFTLWQVDIAREELYARCNARFLAMIEQGALQEVKAVQHEKAAQGVIGVPELSAHLRGEHSLDEAIAAAQQATRNYAKRQLTWFRHQMKEARMIAPGAPPPLTEL